MAKFILLLMITIFLTGCADSKKASACDETEADEMNGASDTVYEIPGAMEQAEATQAVACETGGESMSAPEMRELMYAPYKPFGMVYDKDHNTLTYEGKTVRWFEDYYSVGDGAYAGTDFFDRTGVIDVYAERDFSKRTVSSDGSYDPGGTLTGLKKFSQEEFDESDIEPLLRPQIREATTTSEASAGEEAENTSYREMAAEYSPFGITYYDTPNGGWYYKGEKIRSFKDILTSNGESMNSGKFSGVLRCFGSDAGTVNLATIRDYGRPDAKGYGTLTGVEILELSKDPSDIILSESPSSAP